MEYLELIRNNINITIDQKFKITNIFQEFGNLTKN